jgi:glycosyltransferase involved in cell wall biosynthesis
MGIESRTRFAGQQADAFTFYAAADVFVLPAHHEAFGNVVLEAMASGLPVAVSSRAGACEVFSGELADYTLRDPQDHERLAHLIAQALDPEVRPRLSLEARRTAERYSLDAHTRNVERHYADVLERMQDPARRPPADHPGG